MISHEARLQLMIDPEDYERDLKPEDVKAIKWALAEIERMRDTLEFAAEVLNRQTQFWKKDPCLARLFLDVEATLKAGKAKKAAKGWPDAKEGTL